MINPLLDLKGDYYKYVFSEIDKLMKLGFKFPKNENSDVAKLSTYGNLLVRIPSNEPRKIYYANNFCCPDEYKEGLKQVESEIRNGKSLLRRLSTSILNAKYSDGMLFDFGITHLHLGTKLSSKNRMFVERTHKVLYCLLTNDSAYFITVDDHKHWADINLMKTLYSNFPELIDKYQLNGLSLEKEITEEERIAMRKGGIISFLQLDDKVFAPVGGGITSARTSLRGGNNIIQQLQFLESLEKEIISILEMNSSRIMAERGIYGTLELHFATFSKPLIMFDKNLKYKFCINWEWRDNESFDVTVNIDKVLFNNSIKKML